MEKLEAYKKGQTGNIQALVTGVVTVGIVLAVGLIVLGELQGTQYDATVNATQSEAYTATGSVITELANVPTWIGILITVSLATAVLAAFFIGRN